MNYTYLFHHLLTLGLLKALLCAQSSLRSYMYSALACF